MNGRKYFTGSLWHIDIRFFIKDWVDKEELSIVYFPTHLMLADYFTKHLQGALGHKLREIIVVRVGPFKLLEEKISNTSKERVEKQIPLKDIPSGTVEPLKETENMLEDKNDKQVRTITGMLLKKEEIIRDENDKQVLMSTGEPLKKNEIFRDEKRKLVRTYADVVSTGDLSNERER